MKMEIWTHRWSAWQLFTIWCSRISFKVTHLFDVYKTFFITHISFLYIHVNNNINDAAGDEEQDMMLRAAEGQNGQYFNALSWNTW